MMDKQIIFSPTDSRGNPLIELIEPQRGLEKIASTVDDEVLKFVATLRSEPDVAYILVNALSAGEYFGSNINGDYFPWEALAYEPPGWEIVKKLDLEERRKFADSFCRANGWGYVTFYGGGNFVHHVNFDPYVSRNRHPYRPVGQIVFAYPNQIMKRVELILRVQKDLLERHGGVEFWDSIQTGEFPDVSMGTKVPFDVCSICSNVARTKAEYCEHAKAMMSRLLPDGRRVCVINTRPRFFDISFVLVRADRTGRTFAKVASAFVGSSGSPARPHGSAEALSFNEKMGQPSLLRAVNAIRLAKKLDKQRREKQGAVSKRAILDKPPSGAPSQVLDRAAMGFRDAEQPLPRELLDSAQDVPSFASTAGGMGIVLKPEEFLYLILRLLGHPSAHNMWAGRRSFRPVDEVREFPLSLREYDPDLEERMLPFVEHRSAMGPVLIRRLHMVMHDSPRIQERIADPLLDKISSLYNGYRGSVQELAQQWGMVVASEPKVAAKVFPYAEDELLRTKVGTAVELLSPESRWYLRKTYEGPQTALKINEIQTTRS